MNSNVLHATIAKSLLDNNPVSDEPRLGRDNEVIEDQDTELIVRMTPITSSLCSAMGYEPCEQVLVIQFRKSTSWYKNFEPHEWDLLKSVPEPGKWIRHHVIGNPKYSVVTQQHQQGDE